MCARAGTAASSPPTEAATPATPHVRPRGRIRRRGYGPPPTRSIRGRGQTLDPTMTLREAARAVAVQTQVLVIGSGIAGLTCALQCAKQGPVALVTKDRLPESSSQYAQGGIASVWSPSDSFDSHVDDTLVAGAGLCHRDVVETVVHEGPDRVRELIPLGTSFDLRTDREHGEYDLGREA